MLRLRHIETIEPERVRIKEAFAFVENIPKLGRKGILTIKQSERLRICAGVVCVVRWSDQAPGMKQTPLAFFCMHTCANQ